MPKASPLSHSHSQFPPKSESLSRFCPSKPAMWGFSPWFRFTAKQQSTTVFIWKRFYNMAKRNSVIVLSSDDEENAPKTRSLSSTSSKPKPKPKSTSTGSRGRKKARVSSSAPRLSKLYEVISINLNNHFFNFYELCIIFFLTRWTLYYVATIFVSRVFFISLYLSSNCIFYFNYFELL